MKVHVAYGYGLFTGGLGAHYGAEAAGCTVIPMSGGQTEKQVQLIRDFAPEIIMVTPSYMLAILDEFKRQRIDPRSTNLEASASSARNPGARACARKSNRHSASTPATSTACRKSWVPGVAQEFAAHQGRADDLGGSLSCPRSSIRRTGRVLAGRRGRRIGVHLADQGSHAGDSLPHARSDPAAAGNRRPPCGAWRKSAGASTTC